MIKMTITIILTCFHFLPLSAGKIVNPITDICWECLFPMTVSGVNITPDQKETENYDTKFCFCEGTPPKAGVPLTFWEPLHMIEVTRHAYKLIALGEVTIGKETIKNRGSVGIMADGPTQTSFYHVHWYSYPVFAILGLFDEFQCVSKGKMDMAYMTEFDPFWNDDNSSLIFNAEAGIFANPLAQAACIADCVASSVNKPLDSLFWCAGCEGSLYPFTGNVSHHIGGLQASSLLLQRVLAKHHRIGLTKGHRPEDFCEPVYMPIIKKSIYKTQILYPIAQTSGSCHPLGKSDAIWGVGKSYPVGGEDFVYMIWKKNQCCLDAVKPALKVITGS